MRSFLIHFLGGHTHQEYNRLKEVINDLKNKDARADFYLRNEVAFRVLKDVIEYMRTVLYKMPLEEYASRIYNVLYNNYVVLASVYLYSKVPFRMNLQWDKEETPEVAPEYQTDKEFFILEND